MFVKYDAARTFSPRLTAASTMAPKPLNVVLVEDDLSLGQAMERVLQAAGFQTWVFPSGESMLNSRAAQHASCFVFDVQLPGITGFELQKALEVTYQPDSVDFYHGARRARGARGGREPGPHFFW